MKNIKQLIAEYIKVAEKQIAEHDAIKAILAGLNGKVFDSRTLNTKCLGGFKFNKQYGMYYIRGEWEHLVGYDSSPYIDAEKFEDFDTCHGEANKARVDKLKNIDVARLQEIQSSIAESFSNIISQFEAMEAEKFDIYNNPIYYDMLRAIYNKEDHSGRGIDLADFYYVAKWRKAK